MNNFSCNGKKRIKDCEKKNMVWLLAFKARTRFTKPDTNKCNLLSRLCLIFVSVCCLFYHAILYKYLLMV
jgi:hypothetical protein